MSDLISRQAAIDAVYKCADIFAGDMPVMVVKADAYEALAQLPSVQPETHEKRTETHACDLISRQAAIDAVDKNRDAVFCNSVDYEGVLYDISNLPPSQPEVLACGEGELSAQPENDWISVAKKAHPDLPIRVQVQLNNGWIITAYYQEGEWLSVPDCGEPLKDEYVEAWRELPEPYAERRTDGV